VSRDTRPYIAVTNELFRHPKFRRLNFEARVALLELWAHCNEFMTDGHVDSWVFEEYPPKVREQLLKVGWVDKKAEDYSMHDYLKHQKSKKEILQHKSNKSVAGALGGHTKNHTNKGISKAGCYWCENPNA